MNKKKSKGVIKDSANKITHNKHKDVLLNKKYLSISLNRFRTKIIS